MSVQYVVFEVMSEVEDGLIRVKRTTEFEKIEFVVNTQQAVQLSLALAKKAKEQVDEKLKKDLRNFNPTEMAGKPN